MASVISSVGIRPVTAPIEAPGQTRRDGAFENALKEAIRSVEGMRSSANESVQAFLSGESDELHQTALATQQAELAFELFLQVRNKVVQAYQEVMRMQM